jgi:N-acetyl-gamma-glutamyl-phosphate reductase
MLDVEGQHMIEVAVQNVTGYAGLGAAQLLLKHPEFRLVAVSGRGDAGKSVKTVFPFWPGPDLRIEEQVPAVDLVICALPHGSAAAAVLPLYERGTKIVDISADFRLRSADLYSQWYGAHPAPGLLAEAVYGLPELHAAALRRATLVGNPGCYPTAAILALAPAVQQGLIEPDITIDAKSGISGGGRSLTLNNHFSEVNEAVSAYGIQGHRHLAEIQQELDTLAARPLTIIFTPHIVPMTRGLLATCYAKLQAPLTRPALLDLYRSYYRDAPFVRVVEQPPSTKWASGNNLCYLYPTVSHSGTHLIALGAIDNLVKGAAGQAIQNANIMCGLPEDTGLDWPQQYP